MPKKYKVRTKRVIHGTLHAEAGDIVYKCTGYDYGVANDDTRHYGMEHVSVTKNEDGSYPFFTIPVRHLDEIKGAPT